MANIDYDHLAAEYAQNRRVHPGVLQGLVRGGALGAGSRVLEVGCGTGNYLAALAALTDCCACGVDPSAEMLAYARAQAQDCRFALGRQGSHAGCPQPAWVPGRAENLPFPDRSFDLAFSVDVIHHVTDRATAFHEAYRVLRPGGRVCTVTDSESIIRARVPLAAYFPETVNADLARYPRVEALLSRMAEAGFADLSQETVELSYALTDGRPYRDKAFSVLHLIPEDAFWAGLARLERDLGRGPVAAVSRYVLLWGRRPLL